MIILVILVTMKISSLQQHPDDPNQRKKTTPEDHPSPLPDHDDDDDHDSRIGYNDNGIIPSYLQQPI